MPTSASSKNAATTSQRSRLQKSTKQTKITDFLTEPEANSRGEKSYEPRRKKRFEFDRDKYINCIEKIKDERLRIIASYPLMSASTPWHSVGILRLFSDVNAILRAKKMKEFKYHEFVDALYLMRELGVVDIVDGVVVNFGCVDH